MSDIHRRIYRCQSPGKDFEEQRAKRRFSGALIVTVMPMVANDNAHPSASSGRDNDARQSVRAESEAGMGRSIKGGRKRESRRIGS